MLFLTILFVFSFCFVFFIIWNQFLRKDTRLSIGIKVLQKKMDVLEDFSQKTDIQLSKGIDLLDKKNRELEKIVSEARFCIFKMEKLISGFESKNLLMQKSHKSPGASKKQSIESEKTKQFNFGDSPFSNLSFIEHSKEFKKNPSPPLDCS